MKLYLLRHGDAPYDSQTGERALSARGAEETARVVAARSEELQQLTHIVCSPARRARETLAVVRKTVPLRAELIFDDCLLSDSHVARVEAFVDQLSDDSAAILLVTHQPLIGSIFQYLLDKPQSLPFLGTANLVALELSAFGRGCAELCWLDKP